MPYRRKDTDNWWISFVDQATGKQVRRSAGPDFKAAKALEQQLRAEAHRAKGRRDITVGVVLTYYLENRLTPRTRSTARHLMPLSDLWCKDLTQAAVRQHIKDRQAAGAKPATINKELVMLSAAINAYNVDHDERLANPVVGLKLAEQNAKLRWLTKDEYQRLLNCCDGYLRDLVIVACHTGLRKSELTGLTWSHIDLAHRRLVLEAHETKAGKLRMVPLNHDAMDAIHRLSKSRSDGQVFPVADFKKAFSTACRRANLPDVTPHTLRHTFASWLVIAGVPLYEVSKLMGHGSIKMTERYAHLSPENLRSAVDSLCAKKRDNRESQLRQNNDLESMLASQLSTENRQKVT